MPETTDENGRDEKGKFAPGNPGRPKGSRNKLGERFIADLQADWEEHGPEAIEEVRTSKPDAYLKVVASILPRDLNVNVNKADELTDDELIRRIRDIDAAIRPFLASQGEAGTDGDTEAETRH